MSISDGKDKDARGDWKTHCEFERSGIIWEKDEIWQDLTGWIKRLTLIKGKKRGGRRKKEKKKKRFFICAMSCPQ